MSSIKYCSCIAVCLFRMYFTGMNYSSSQQLQEMTSLVTWDLYSIVNDPQSQMIPKMDRKWSWTATNSHCRRQVILWKVEEWNGFQTWMVNVLRTWTTRSWNNEMNKTINNRAVSFGNFFSFLQSSIWCLLLWKFGIEGTSGRKTSLSFYQLGVEF